MRRPHLPENRADFIPDDYQSLPAEAEKAIKARRVEDLKEFLGQLDILTVNCPLHETTKGIINKETLSYMKPGAWIVNTARGALCVAEDIAAALKSGHIAGYAGDVWNQQPAPKDHCWRNMRGPNGNGNGMVAHYSCVTLLLPPIHADLVAGELPSMRRSDTPPAPRTSSTTGSTARLRSPPTSSSRTETTLPRRTDSASERCPFDSKKYVANSTLPFLDRLVSGYPSLTWQQDISDARANQSVDERIFPFKS